MHYEEKLVEGLYWIGGDDMRLGQFEGVHPVPQGMSYSNYLILDEKTVLMDTIDRAVEERFIDTVDYLLDGRNLDYIVVQHVEPDHSASLEEVATRHPEATIVCSGMAKRMIGQFFDEKLAARCQTVKEGDTLECGVRTLEFFTAPMVHWPEVMVTYCAHDKVLFSADAFGTFGGMKGRLYDDEFEFETEYLPEARRYYANIVGKYGDSTLAVLKKAATLDIQMVCPLHGPVLRRYIAQMVEKYQTWGAYEPEEQSVAVIYASVYGGTRDVAEALAFKLRRRGVAHVSINDLTIDDSSYALSEVFRASNVVLASVTYNMGLFPRMATLLHDMAEHGVKSRRFSFVQNGTWAPQSGKLMQAAVDKLEGCEQVGEMLTIKSRLKDEQDADLDALVSAIIASLDTPLPEPEVVDVPQETGAPTQAAAPDGKAKPKPIDPALMKGLVPPTGNPYGQRNVDQKVIEVWKCTYCGYEVEVPAGTDMSNFTCPVCLKVGLFKKSREKIVPAGQ